jgi:hypothetical protein
MPKLNQIIAIEKGIKSQAYAAVTLLHKAIQKPDLFNGFSKDYSPKGDDEDEKLPSERKRVQYNVTEVLRAVERETTQLMNITARKDYTNCVAKATVMVNGHTIIKDAPVSYLLFMEKQLNDMRAVVTELPVLDENETWHQDANSGLYKAEATQTHRTKKVQKPLVLYPATAEHPAQTQVMTEDIIAGFWSQVKQSGAMPKPKKQALLQRVDVLQQAVKQARESANMTDEVPSGDPGKAVFTYLLGD